MAPKIIISGFYCGPSPSAGLGIAKSLRATWPSAHIIGVDYWEGASGLHDSVLSERLIYPSWDVIDTTLHAQTMREFSTDHFILSALDIEIAWMSRALPSSPNLLIPSRAALTYADKPHIRAAEFLPFQTPSIHIENGDDQALHDFCRSHSWRVWVKGPFHGAQFVTNWRDLEQARMHLAKQGSRAHVSYQAHVRGLEESICFSAVDGKLCAAVHMQKRVITPEGKTWSGKIRPLSPRQQKIVQEAVQQMHWNGGGEFELIRDESDTYWLMEFNPRFPAWIYGATIAGVNLPAMMLAEAGQIHPGLAPVASSSEFTRIVTEIPVLPQISLPQVRQPEHGDVSAQGKYGAGLSALETQLLDPPLSSAAVPSAATRTSTNLNSIFDRSLLAATKSATSEHTPTRIYLTDVIAERFRAATSLNAMRHADCQLQVAYSIKTCPDPVYLQQARSAGMLAEAISMAEVELALASGWSVGEIILNGPAKWWPRSMQHHQGLNAVFCDSLDEFERLVKFDRRDLLWGLRLKIPGFSSRFGADLATYEDMVRAVSLVQSMPTDIKFGIHVHMASNLIGKGHWQDAVESALAWASDLTYLSGKHLSMFDLGGGYHPRDFSTMPWQEILTYAKHRAPTLQAVTIEPGRALSQDSMAMLTTIQDVRRRNGEILEVVVDTCISDLPLARVYPHRMYMQLAAGVAPIGPGRARILGRICMEDDILADAVDLPASIKIGDRIIIADSGAYERSMSYEFGYGRTNLTH